MSVNPAPEPPPAPRAFRRPFLTKRVLRGLATLAKFGWPEIEDGPVRLKVEHEADALYAKRWIERMTAFKDEEKEERS